jgi:translation elongation factor EF-Ts
VRRDDASPRTAELQLLAHELAMHIVAMAPRVVDASQLNIDEWNQELAQLSSSRGFATMLPTERIAAVQSARERFERSYCLLKYVFVMLD